MFHTFSDDYTTILVSTATQSLDSFYSENLVKKCEYIEHTHVCMKKCFSFKTGHVRTRLCFDFLIPDSRCNS